MLIKKGTQSVTGYSGGEGYVNYYELEARGETLKELQADIMRITEENSDDGHRIDFGFVSGIKTVEWEDNIYEIHEFIPPTGYRPLGF